MLSARTTHPSFNTVQKIGLNHIFGAIECIAHAIIESFYFTHLISFFLSLLHGCHFFHTVLQMAAFALPLWSTRPLTSLFMCIRPLAQQWMGFVLCTSETLNLERVTVHGCLWLQLSVLSKLRSFPWDGSNLHTVFHLVSWACFVGLDTNMWSCRNRLCLICSSLFLYWAVISSDVWDRRILSCLVQQQQSHALSCKAVLVHWVCLCGKEVKFPPATLLCWGCGFKMKI